MAAEAPTPAGGWQAFSDGIYYVGVPDPDGTDPILFHDYSNPKDRRPSDSHRSTSGGVTIL